MQNFCMGKDCKWHRTQWQELWNVTFSSEKLSWTQIEKLFTFYLNVYFLCLLKTRLFGYLSLLACVIPIFRYFRERSHTESLHRQFSYILDPRKWNDIRIVHYRFFPLEFLLALRLKLSINGQLQLSIGAEYAGAPGCITRFIARPGASLVRMSPRKRCQICTTRLSRCAAHVIGSHLIQYWGRFDSMGESRWGFRCEYSTCNCDEVSEAVWLRRRTIFGCRQSDRVPD